jgi:iron complex outermembrane receptor protein
MELYIQNMQGEKLSGVTTFIHRAGQNILQGEGHFVADSVCTGKVTVYFAWFGGGRDSLHLEVGTDTLIVWNIEAKAIKLSEFTVHDEHPAHGFAEEVLLREVDRLQSTGKPIGEMLKTVAGISSLNTGSNISKPVIRGLSGNRTIFINNGVRLESQMWGAEHAPEIDPLSAATVRIIKGAGSLCYGQDISGGVVITESKPLPSASGLKGELTAAGATNGRQGTLSGNIEGNFTKLKPFTWRLQGSVRRGGNVSTPGYYLKNTGILEYAHQAELGWRQKAWALIVRHNRFNTHTGILSAAHIGNLTDLEAAIQSSEPLETSGFTYSIDRPMQKVLHETLSAQLNIVLGSSTKNIGMLELKYARQYNGREEYDKHRPRNDSLELLNEPELKMILTSHNASVNWQYQYESFETEAGITGQYQGNTYRGRFFIPNYIRYQGGFYVLQRFRSAKSTFSAEVGVRADAIAQQAFMWRNGSSYNPKAQYRGLAFQAAIQYAFKIPVHVKFNFSSTWRPPSINEMYSNGLHHSSASIEKGNADLKPERSTQAGLSFEYEGKRIQFGLSPFINYMPQYIYLEPDTVFELTIRGAFPVFHYRQTAALLSGTEATLNLEIFKGLNFTAMASLLRADNLTRNEPLPLIPPFRMQHGLEYTLNTGKKIPVLRMNVSLLSVFQQKQIPTGVDFAPPPPAYHLVDAGITAEIASSAGTIITGIKVANVLNVSYRDYLNRFRYFADEPGRNIQIFCKIPLNFTTPAEP